MTFKIRTFSYEERIKAFWALIVVSTICLIVYVLALNFTIRNTVARQALESKTANLSAHIGELEFSYITLKNKVSLDLAYARGFKEVTSPIYISKTASRSLTLNR